MTYYSLETSQTGTLYFEGVNNLGSENDIIMSWTGGSPEVLVLTPGVLRWKDIVIYHGLSSNMDLENWRRLVVEHALVGVHDYKFSGTITQYNNSWVPIASWNITNMFPCDLEVLVSDLPAFNGGVVEKVTFAHEGLVRVA
jgi:phage tail-like protein